MTFGHKPKLASAWVTIGDAAPSQCPICLPDAPSLSAVRLSDCRAKFTGYFRGFVLISILLAVRDWDPFPASVLLNGYLAHGALVNRIGS
jgi:hypothetical protein